MKILVTLPDTTVRQIDAKPGERLMQQMRALGVPVMGDCGGALACATCHVKVADDWLAKVGPPGAEESDLLDMSAYLGPTSRLACQIALTPALDGLQVELQLDALEG